jgi:hypothetical protein
MATHVEIEIQCSECKKNMVHISIELWEHAQKHGIDGYVCEPCYNDMKQRYTRPRGGFGGYNPAPTRRIVRGTRRP